MLRDCLWVFAAEYRAERTQRLATSRISVPFEDVIVTDVLVQGLGNLIPAYRLMQQHVANYRVLVHFIGGLGASAFDRFARTLAKQSEHVCLLVKGFGRSLHQEVL